MTRKIITSNVYPPIETRKFDWMAYREGDEELGARGFGETEQEAIDDLVNNYPDDGAGDWAPKSRRIYGFD